MPGCLLYVDETKARGYVMVAVTVEPRTLPQIRRDLRGLLRPGQRSIHFRKESDRRRREIVSSLMTSDWSATVLSSSSRRESTARAECLAAVVDIAVDSEAAMVVFERDDSTLHQDRRVLFTELRRQHSDHVIRYQHLWRHEDAALWLPDTVAWCFARGGDWLRRISPRIGSVRDVG